MVNRLMSLMFGVSLLCSFLFGHRATAQDSFEAPADSLAESIDRDPAAAKSYAGKRTYPGGSDEEDLQVQARVSDAVVKTDPRAVQREVFKNLYNQEMKDERQETVEE